MVISSRLQTITLAAITIALFSLPAHAARVGILSERLTSPAWDGEMIVVFSPLTSASKERTDRIATHRHERIAAARDAIMAELAIPTGSIRRPFRNFPVIHLHGDLWIASRLAADPRVTYVGENRRFSPALASSLSYIDAPLVHAVGKKGEGTAVAVLDTGVDYTRSPFGPCTAPGVPSTCSVVAAIDTAPDDGRLDDDGHGTNVAGVVLGTAPDTKIVSIDVFDGPFASDSDILEALDWVLSNRQNYGIVAVNLSLGDSSAYTTHCPQDPISPAVAALKEAGVVTVIASGNNAFVGGTFLPGISSPACVPDAVSVGAVYDSNVGSVNAGICTDASTQAGKPACFSQAAPILSLTAPGVFVTAAGSTYSGTSQAAPHVAGGIAILKGAHPSLPASRVIGALVGGAASITDKRFSPNLTFPRLDLDGALSHFPTISVSPAAADFGQVPTGSSAIPREITVSAGGGVPLSIGTIALTSDVSGDFSLISDGCSGTSFPPGGSCKIMVGHTPSPGGTRTASLSIPSDDPDFPVLQLPLLSQDVPFHTLSVSVSGEGQGTVVSAPAGIVCPPTCSAPFPSGSDISLSILPAPASFVAGWPLPECSGGGPCSIRMDTDRGVAVTFGLKPVSTSSGSGFTSLEEAFASVGGGETILLREGEILGNPSLLRDVQVILVGGYDPSFDTRRSVTVIVGSLAVAAGSIETDGIVIR